MERGRLPPTRDHEEEKAVDLRILHSNITTFGCALHVSEIPTRRLGVGLSTVRVGAARARRKEDRRNFISRTHMVVSFGPNITPLIMITTFQILAPGLGGYDIMRINNIVLGQFLDIYFLLGHLPGRHWHQKFLLVRSCVRRLRV